MKTTRISASRTKRLSLCNLLIGLLSCGALMAGVLDVQTTLADPRQTPADDFRASELDAGFDFLYELKFEEARKQFEAWQKSHPEATLGSGSGAAADRHEDC